MGINRDLLKQRITEARKARGWTQGQLAKMAKVTPAAISQIESGARLPMLPVLQKIADTLKVSLDFLAGRTDTSELDAMINNEDVQTFFRNFQQLSPDDQDTIKKNVEFLKGRKS